MSRTSHSGVGRTGQVGVIPMLSVHELDLKLQVLAARFIRPVNNFEKVVRFGVAIRILPPRRTR